jgi:hypothetical protein
MVSLNQCFIESSDRQELLQIANRKEELHDINQSDVFSGTYWPPITLLQVDSAARTLDDLRGSILARSWEQC